MAQGRLAMTILPILNGCRKSTLKDQAAREASFILASPLTSATILRFFCTVACSVAEKTRCRPGSSRVSGSLRPSPLRRPK
jgi:hypothetical protein